MLASVLPVASLLVSTFFMLVAGGLAGYLLPLRAVAEGWSTFTVSLIATGYAVARHHLLGVDLVVNRLTVWGTVTGVLVGAYLGAAAALAPVPRPRDGRRRG